MSSFEVHPLHRCLSWGAGPGKRGCGTLKEGGYSRPLPGVHFFFLGGNIAPGVTTMHLPCFRLLWLLKHGFLRAKCLKLSSFLTFFGSCAPLVPAVFPKGHTREV